MKSLGKQDADSLENGCELKYFWSLCLKLGEKFLKAFHFLQQTGEKASRRLAGDFIKENTWEKELRNCAQNSLKTKTDIPELISH